jgi:hypothetical protein
MLIELINGKRLHFPDADRCSSDDTYLYVEGRRNRRIATFRLDAVAGWWYDTEDEEALYAK